MLAGKSLSFSRELQARKPKAHLVIDALLEGVFVG
jgi:hypothetical protein